MGARPNCHNADREPDPHSLHRHWAGTPVGRNLFLLISFRHPRVLCVELVGSLGHSISVRACRLRTRLGRERTIETVLLAACWPTNQAPVRMLVRGL